MKAVVSLNPKDSAEQRGWRPFIWPVTHEPVERDLSEREIAFLRAKGCVVVTDEKPPAQEVGAPFDEPLPLKKHTKKDKEA